MAAKYKVTQFVKEYVEQVDGNWGYVEVRKKYECSNIDALENLTLTLVDCSIGSVKLEISKEEVSE